MVVSQGKTGKKLRIRLRIGDQLTGLGAFIDGLLERRRLTGIKNSPPDHQQQRPTDELCDAPQPLG